MFDGDNIECVADALLKHNLFSNMECYLNDVDVCATLRDLNEGGEHMENRKICQQISHILIDTLMPSAICYQYQYKFDNAFPSCCSSSIHHWKHSALVELMKRILI